MKTNLKPNAAAAAITCSLLILALSARAAAFYWDGTTNTWPSVDWYNISGVLVAGGTTATDTYSITNGAVTFAGANTFGDANTTTSPAITIGNTGTLASGGYFNTLWNLTLQGGTLNPNGGGSASLPAFQLDGTLTVSGTLASTITAGSGSFPQINIGGSSTTANTLTLNVADVTADPNPDLTIAASLQDGRSPAVAGSVTKTGAGTLVLSGANTYSGNTTVSAGLLVVNGTYTGVPAGSKFVANGGSIKFDMGAGSATFYADGYAGSPLIGDGNFTGAVTLQSGTLNVATKTSGTAASLRLGCNGASANGTLIVNGGTLNVPGRILMAANTSGSKGTFTLNGGTVNLGTVGSGTYTDPGSGLIWFGGYTSTVNLYGGTLALYSLYDPTSGSSVTVTLSGVTLKAVNNNTAFVNQTAGTMTLKVSTNGVTINPASYAITIPKALTHDSGLSGPDGGLTVADSVGGGTVTLSGANTYTGPTTISSGTLSISGAGNLGNGVYSGNLAINGALNYVSSVNQTFAGALSGSGSLTNGGTATLTLSGANNFSGGLVMNGGKLAISTRNSGGNASVVLNPGTTISVTNATAGQAWTCAGLVFASGTTTFDVNFGTTTPSPTVAPLQVNGSVVFGVTPTITIESSSALPSGVYPLMTWASSSGTPPTAATITPTIPNTLTVSNNTLYLNITSRDPLRWALTGSGIWDVGVSQNWRDNFGAPAAYLDSPADSVLFDQSFLTASAVITLNTSINPSGVTVNDSTNSYTFAGTGGIGGTNGLTKLGAGTLAIGIANTFTGGSAINGGLVVLNAAESAGVSGPLGQSPAGNAGNISLGGGFLQHSVVNTYDYSGRFSTVAGQQYNVDTAGRSVSWATGLTSSNGTLTVMDSVGGGALTLNGTSTYAGPTVINGGSLTLGSTGQLGAGTYAGNITNNAVFNFAGSGAQVLSGALSGIGSLLVTGPGTLTLAGPDTCNGVVVVNGGMLAVTNTGTLGNSNTVVQVNPNGTLSFNRNDTFGNNLSTPTIVMVINGGAVNNTANGAAYYNTLENLTLTNGGSLQVWGGVNANFQAYQLKGLVSSRGTLTNYLELAAAPVNGLTSVQVGSNALYTVTTFDVEEGPPAGSGLVVTAPLGDGRQNAGSLSGTNGITKIGPGTLELDAINTYTGPTTVSNGTLLVSGALGGGSVTVAGGVLSGNGTIGGSVTVLPGGTLLVGTTNLDLLSVGGNLNLSGNLVFRISKTAGILAQNQMLATLVTYGGTLTVTNITSDGTPLAAGDMFRLFSASSYGGVFTNFNLPSLPAGLTWDKSGLANAGTIAVTASTATPIFSPAPGGYVGTQQVVVSSDPGSTIYYTTDGTDPMYSSTVMSSPNPATISIPANTNGLMITAYASTPARGASPETTATYYTVITPTWITPSDGSWTLSANWSNTVVGAGSGVTADFSQLTLSADTTVTLDGPQTIGNLLFGDVGGAYAWTLSAGSGGPLTLDGTNSVLAIGNPGATISVAILGTNNLIKTGPGRLSLTNAANQFSGSLTINKGVVLAAAATGGLNPAGGSLGADNTPRTITVNPGAALAFGATDVLGNHASTMNVGLVINSGAVVSNTGAFYNTLGTLTLNGGTLTSVGGNGAAGIFDSYSLKGDVTVGGTNASTISQSGTNANICLGAALVVGTTFNVADATGDANPDLIVSAILTDGAMPASPYSAQPSYLTKTGPGTMVLTTNNIYSGITTVSNGTLWVNGSLASGSAVTVLPGGTLGGTGIVNGTVTNYGTLAPGAGTIGTLTINNTAILSGTTWLKINKSANPSNDVLTASTLTYGGTLAVTNLGGALALGDSFTLFTFGRQSGSFTAASLPPLGSGLAWNWNAASGTLSVVSGVNTTPIKIGFSVSGGALNLSWPADHLGWHLQSQANPLTTGLSTNWVTIPGSDTITSTNIPINLAHPATFYRLVYP